jgi:hypothetical protein
MNRWTTPFAGEFACDDRNYGTLGLPKGEADPLAVRFFD